LWSADGTSASKLTPKLENAVNVDEKELDINTLRKLAVKKHNEALKQLQMEDNNVPKKMKVKKEMTYLMYGCKCNDCRWREYTAEKSDTVQRDFQRRNEILLFETQRVENCSYAERKQMCKEQIRFCANNSSARSSWHYRWHIGSNLDGVGEIDCCKHGFAKFYGISTFTVDTLISELKRGQRQVVSRVNKKQYEQFTVEQVRLRKDAELLGFELTQDMISSMRLADTPASKDCHTWLRNYIQLVGDPQPNRRGEIHLDDAATHKDIYNEYFAAKKEDKSHYLEPVGYVTFIRIWKICFPHVKIRKAKAVDTKCATCTYLTFLRKRAKSNEERAELTRLMTWHRVTFMGERKLYYERRYRAWYD
jgi:hypothetical protein